MKTFIRSAACISPQHTFNNELFFADAVEYNNNCLDIIEPDYKNLLDIKQMRRMSKIVRIGVAAALKCLQEAGMKNANAIITGTAYGCMEDSETFLKKIVMQDEEMLSPTPFIQSTHNTVGAQVALILKCHNYNNTFVHRGFSFEYALLDAMLLLNEQKAQYVLAGSADEITELTFNVLKRFGIYKQLPVSNFSLYNSATKGSIAGQGTAFFLLSAEAAANDLAVFEAADFFYKPVNVAEIKKRINSFLAAHNISMDDIDLIITGENGDVKNDAFYQELKKNIFSEVTSICYKHLCGEYPTSSSFAMWLAANIIKLNKLPVCYKKEALMQNNFKRVLIYNNFQQRYHSLILISHKIQALH